MSHPKRAFGDVSNIRQITTMSLGAIFFVRPLTRLKRLMFWASGVDSGHNASPIFARFFIWVSRSKRPSNVLMIFIFCAFLWAVGGDAAALD